MAKRKPSNNVEQLAIKLFHKFDRPLLIGELALHLHESIDVVEEMLEEFTERQIVRRLTQIEKDKKGMHSIVIAYVLDGKAELKMAYDSPFMG